MTLVPREGYGLGFMIALFMVAVALVGKGNALAALIYGNNSNTGYSYRILYWIGTNALPSFCYVSTYSILLVKNTADCIFAFSSTYLCAYYTDQLSYSQK